jgi:hypothetical protein
MTSHAGTTWIDYDYAVVRLVPYVHLESFMNIGVVLHARRENYLEARFVVDRERVASFAPTIDIPLLDRYIDAYCRVCRGGADAGPVGLLPASERFHWLTAPRSAVIQTSAVHPGRGVDARAELEKLVRSIVG